MAREFAFVRPSLVLRFSRPLIGTALAVTALWPGTPARAAGASRLTVSRRDLAATCGVSACPADLAGMDSEERAICDAQDWAMKQIGMRQLWEREGVRTFTGRGVRIAHIDTGYTDHPALPKETTVSAGGTSTPGDSCQPFGAFPTLSEGGVAPGEGFDFEDGCPDTEQCGPREPNARRDPHDPLLPAHFLFDRQPGHGTGTLGMLTAPGICLPGAPQKADRFLIGVAPGATVIPFRVANGVIMSEGRVTRVVEALLNAVTTQVIHGVDGEGRKVYRPSVDVVTISHGRRSPTQELEEAILTAERNGVIVVAASGEYPFFSPVRFPAQFPTVVGVTGTRVDGTPWSGIFGAGRGPSAKIAAPAYRVWHAETKVVGGMECPTAVTGKGTSFSAPIVAGAAALWLEKYNQPKPGHVLGRLVDTYGPSAVPALFRYFLRPHDKKEIAAFRSPEDLCHLARKEEWPNRDRVCAHQGKSWDTKRWGQGVLAVDKLLALDPDHDFPAPKDLCREVYLAEGIGAWNRACPIGSPGRTDDESTTSGVVQENKPAQEPQERWTRLAGASFGRPFGSHAGIGPALDYGIIFSHHYYHAPRGLLLQVQYAQGGNLGLGLGFGAGFGYDPYRDSKRSWSVIPGFGPAASIAIKAAYLRARTEVPGHANLVGAQAQVCVLKLKAQFGVFRDVDGDRWRKTWDFGVGF